MESSLAFTTTSQFLNFKFFLANFNKHTYYSPQYILNDSHWLWTRPYLAIFQINLNKQFFTPTLLYIYLYLFSFLKSNSFIKNTRQVMSTKFIFYKKKMIVMQNVTCIKLTHFKLHYVKNKYLTTNFILHTLVRDIKIRRG